MFLHWNVAWPMKSNKKVGHQRVSLYKLIIYIELIQRLSGQQDNNLRVKLSQKCPLLVRAPTKDWDTMERWQFEVQAIWLSGRRLRTIAIALAQRDSWNYGIMGTMCKKYDSLWGVLPSAQRRVLRLYLGSRTMGTMCKQYDSLGRGGRFAQRESTNFMSSRTLATTPLKFLPVFESHT